MAFIKLQNLVINTDYIAAVQLENQSSSEEDSVSILLAPPGFPLKQLSRTCLDPYHNVWIDFTGDEAEVLRCYFGDVNNSLAGAMLSTNNRYPSC